MNWSIEAVIAAISLIVSICALIKSIKADSKAEASLNRPGIDIEALEISLSKAEIYAGINSGVVKERQPLIGERFDEKYDYEKVIKENAKKLFYFHHKNKEGVPTWYMLVNLCGSEGKPIDFRLVSLAFDVLNIRLKFEYQNNVKINYIWVKNCCSIGHDNESFDPTAKIDLVFPVHGNNSFDIPVAYARIRDLKASMRLEKIVNDIENRDTETIDLLGRDRNKARDYLSFIETGYLIECETTDGKNPKYSIILKVDKENGSLEKPLISEGRKEFFNRAKAYEVVNGQEKRVIQNSVENPTYR